MAPAPRRGALILDLTTAANLATTKLARELATMGISMELLGLLFEIRLAQPVTPTALAARTGHPLTTLSDYVQRLVERGEVRRDPNPEDRRSHLLSVTPAGQERITGSSHAVRRLVMTLVPLLERPLAEYEDAVAELRAALTEA